MIHPDVEAADAIVKAVENGAVGSILAFDDSDLEIARTDDFSLIVGFEPRFLA